MHKQVQEEKDRLIREIQAEKKSKQSWGSWFRGEKVEITEDEIAQRKNAQDSAMRFLGDQGGDAILEPGMREKIAAFVQDESSKLDEIDLPGKVQISLGVTNFFVKIADDR